MYRVRPFLALLALAVGSAGCDRRATPTVAPPRVENLEEADPAVIEAVRAATRGVTASPESAATWGHLAMVLLAHDFFRDSVGCFREASRLAPDDPRWPYLQGLALLKGDPDPNAAVPLLRRAAQLTTRETVAHLKLGEVLLEQGELDQAKARFRLALTRDATSARAHLGLGRVAYLRGDLETAMDHLSASARVAPRVKATHALLAELRFRAGDREGAERERRLLSGLPDTHHWPDPYFSQVLETWVGVLASVDRANDLVGKGRRDEAFELLRGTIQRQPEALLARLALGRFLLQADRSGEAEKVLRGAVSVAPEAFEAHHELGLALLRQGRVDDAASCFAKTIAIKPGYAPAHFQLARCRLGKGERNGALEALEAAVRHRPDYAEAQRALGHLLAQDHRYAEAVVHLRHAVRLRPSDEKARLLLDEVSRQLQR